jgi:hypothetical protein
MRELESSVHGTCPGAKLVCLRASRWQGCERLHPASWDMVVTSADLWTNIIKEQPSASKKGVKSLAAPLIAYELWLERNQRLFSEQNCKIRPVKDIVLAIR